MGNAYQPVEQTVIYCKRSDEIPKKLHWAIISTRTGTEPGYDHGDPPSSFNFVEYIAYLSHAEWRAEIVKRTLGTQTSSNRLDFVAMEVKPAEIKTEVNVNIAT